MNNDYFKLSTKPDVKKLDEVMGASLEWLKEYAKFKTAPEPMADEGENEKLIAWTFKKLDDPKYYRQVTSEILMLLMEFYSPLNKPWVLKALKKKMTAGSKKHGSPPQDEIKLLFEQAQEWLDCLGWRMIQKWQERKSSKNT